jgi:hypothetical protein
MGLKPGTKCLCYGCDINYSDQPDGFVEIPTYTTKKKSVEGQGRKWVVSNRGVTYTTVKTGLQVVVCPEARREARLQCLMFGGRKREDAEKISESARSLYMCSSHWREDCLTLEGRGTAYRLKAIDSKSIALPTRGVSKRKNVTIDESSVPILRAAARSAAKNPDSSPHKRLKSVLNFAMKQIEIAESIARLKSRQDHELQEIKMASQLAAKQLKHITTTTTTTSPSCLVQTMEVSPIASDCTTLPSSFPPRERSSVGKFVPLHSISSER